MLESTSDVSKAPRNFRQLPADNFVHSRSSPHIRERYSLRLISDEETSATCAIRQTETRNSLKRFERLRASWAESRCPTLPRDLIKNKRRAYETTWLIIFRIIANYARWILIAKREILVVSQIWIHYSLSLFLSQRIFVHMQNCNKYLYDKQVELQLRFNYRVY